MQMSEETFSLLKPELHLFVNYSEFVFVKDPNGFDGVILEQ